MAKVVIVLTEKEAEELFMVANSGFGNGDYYDARSGNNKAAFKRAFQKLYEARFKVTMKKKGGR